MLPDMRQQVTEEKRNLASRRQAMEPITGRPRSDHSFDRCYLNGQAVGAIHAVLCAARLQPQVAGADDTAIRHQAFFSPLFCPRNTSFI